MLATARLQSIVCTARLEAVSRFYEDTLGLTCKASSHGARVYDVGGGELRLSPVPTLAQSEHTVVGFAVTDIASVVAALGDRGVRLERFANFPQDPRGFLALPDGNLLSIVQYA